MIKNINLDVVEEVCAELSGKEEITGDELLVIGIISKFFNKYGEIVNKK